MAYDPNIHFYDDPGHPYWPADGNWHESGVVPGGGSSEPDHVKLFEETVTTTAGQYGNMTRLTYVGEIMDDPLHVVFDGVEYDLPRLEHGNYGAMSNGSPDFSTYPLFLGYSSNNPWTLITETAGTHTVAAYSSSVPIVMYEISAIGDERDLRVDSRGKLDSMDSFLDYGDVCICNNYDSSRAFLGKVQGGLWVAVSLMPPSTVDANQLSVFYDNMGQHGDELPNVSKFVGDDSYVTLTFQVPPEISGGYDGLVIDTNGGGGGPDDPH